VSPFTAGTVVVVDVLVVEVDVEVDELVEVDATTVVVVDGTVVDDAVVVVTMECCTSLHAASDNTVASATATDAAGTRRIVMG
jgi:hypothetical protein